MWLHKSVGDTFNRLKFLSLPPAVRAGEDAGAESESDSVNIPTSGPSTNSPISAFDRDGAVRTPFLPSQIIVSGVDIDATTLDRADPPSTLVTGSQESETVGAPSDEALASHGLSIASFSAALDSRNTLSSGKSERSAASSLILI